MSDALYFDHAAATTVRPEVWAAVAALPHKNLGNPSSVHQFGRRARGYIDTARVELAEAFMVSPEEVIFTSGATEALHTSIMGAYLARVNKRGVVYTSPLVHHCVWAALDFLKNNYQVEVKLLPIDKVGALDLERITESMIGECDLIVTEHLNSEMGVLQPAAKLGKKITRWAETSGQDKPIYIVDAAASVVGERVGLDFQKCDALALSGEKFGALSGSGVLLKRKSLPLTPWQAGSQEWGWRGGSENVLGIVALNVAYQKHLAEQAEQNQRFEHYWQQLYHWQQAQPNTTLITPQTPRGGHILHFLLPHPAHLFVAQADLAGVAVSAGSACSSGSVEGSRVLANLGYRAEQSQQGLRISWGWDTSLVEVERLGEKLKLLLAN